MKLLENTDGNLCRATEERTYRLTVKLCPPPEDPLFTLCSAFSKSVWQKDYWQKQGAVDVWMKFYERGETRAEISYQWHFIFISSLFPLFDSVITYLRAYE